MMKDTVSVIFIESLKIRRSKIFSITVFLSVFVPLMMAFMMFIAKNPETAHKFGLLGAKATVINLQANWPTYFGILNMAMTGVGMVLFGFITSWVFGREYSDNTMKDLLAIPVRRTTIVASKFIVTAVWSIMLSAIFYILGISAGALINMTGWTNDLFLKSIGMFFAASALTIMLSMPVGLAASISRGYLLPVGFVIAVLMLSQFAGALGFSQYFPWSIPMVYVSDTGGDGVSLNVISYLILAITSILGLLSTRLWWCYADHK